MDDLLKNPDDIIDVDPPELEQAFVDAISNTVAKQLADAADKPWTDAQESEMQEKISALVGAANALGLKSFRLNVTRPNGEKVSRDLDIQKIHISRSLQ